MKAMVLFSGGIDSTTCLGMAVEKYGSENVIALSIAYGQKHTKEIEASDKIVKYYNVEHIYLDLAKIFQYSDCSLLSHSDKEIPKESYNDQIKSTNGSPVSTYVPFRNGLFLSSAASIAISKGCSVIYYGAHADDAAGSAYPDCSSDFNNAINEAIYLGSGKQIKVVAPFINATKDQVVKKGLKQVAMMIDPKGEMISKIEHIALVDAILAKKNLGTTMDMAPITIGLGPGFCAGQDVHVVVETMRGHNLGRLIYEGCALPNTGVPGNIKGYSKERVIHSPCAGVCHNVKKITDIVEKGEILAYINETPVYASMSGLLRGLIQDGYNVTSGFKMADIDPRVDEYQNCFTISDKARCIAGGVLEAILHGLS